MAADDDSSGLSEPPSRSPTPSLSEPEEEPVVASKGIKKFFKPSDKHARQPSPPPRKRSPSPPHEFVLADNPDIAFIVMFRNRFTDGFSKSLPHFGPQELERDVVASVPGDRAELFLCAILGLLLNRKQDVKPGHYGRALEDAVSSHKNQWPRSWEGKNPLSGNTTFNSMTPVDRLSLLRTLILWSMASSETVKAIINQAYKQNRHEDDVNQARSVQPWGSDGDKRRYFLVEGQDDSAFRVYRESNPAGLQRTWWSVAGSIEELNALAEKLATKDGGPKARILAQKMLGAIPRFEAGEEKRRRREYRQTQKERFKRPDPGFSMYEGRTRGKRMKYTYSDDEDVFNSDSTNRRSARNTGANTPAAEGPTMTASGRQIRAPPRLNAETGDSGPGSTYGDGSEYDQEMSLGPAGRPRRSAAHNGVNGLNGDSRLHPMDSEDEDGASEADDEDGEVDDGDAHVPEESDEEDEFEEDEAMAEDDLDDAPRSLMVKLSVTPPKLRTALDHLETAPNTQPETKLERKLQQDKTDVEMFENTDLETNDVAADSVTVVTSRPPKTEAASPEVPEPPRQPQEVAVSH